MTKLEAIEQTLSLEEFMSRLNIKSRTTVYRWIRSRYIKTTKVGRQRMIPVSELARISKAKYGI